MDKDGNSQLLSPVSRDSRQDMETHLQDASTLIRDDVSTSSQQGTNTEVSDLLNIPIQMEKLGVVIEEKESEKTFLDATLGGLKILKMENALYDVKLVVEGVQIKCHKVILAIFSEYFRAMFTREMEEEDQNEIHLTGFRCKTIQKMITLLYEGYGGFTAADGRELLEASIFFRVESLRHMCEKALSMVLDVINVKVFWRTTNRFPECTILCKSCEEYMLLHFNTLPEKEICNLSKNELAFLLSNQTLRVSNEDKVFQAAMIWFKHDMQKRKQYLAEIFQHVRLPFVSKSIYSEFKNSCDFHGEPDVQPFTEEVEHHQNYPSCQMEELSSSRTRLRQHYDIEKVILVIGYKQRITCTDPCMWAWRFGHRQWYTLNSSPAKLGNGYATCRYGKSEVFFCGGQGKRTFLKFDGLTDTILPCTQMSAARMSHCMVCTEDTVYVLGGTGFQYDKEQACLVEDKLEGVEQWRPLDSKWQQCGHIVSPVSGATACVSGSLILIYGGYIDKKDKEPSDTAQFYDTKTNTCGYLANNLPFRYGNLKSVSVKGVTYILANSEIFESNCKDESGYNIVQTLKDKFDCQNYRSLSSAMASDAKYLYFLKECFSTRIAMYDETSWDLRRYDIETRKVENASENIQFLKSSVSMYTLVVGKSILKNKSVVKIDSS